MEDTNSKKIIQMEVSHITFTFLTAFGEILKHYERERN